jgi:hypothetical protein
MPQFIREMVARGFWWAILASFIFCIPFGVVSFLIGKKSKFLQAVVQQVPGVLFYFYIWHIREHTGWLVFAIICSIVVFIGLCIQLFIKAAKKTGEGSDAFIANFLSSCADAANKDFPKMIDSETRLDKTLALPNKVFQYHFTLINHSKDEINPEELKKGLQAAVLNNLKTNSVFDDFRNYKVTVEYLYHDKNNDEILRLIYEPNDYS